MMEELSGGGADVNEGVGAKIYIYTPNKIITMKLSNHLNNVMINTSLKKQINQLMSFDKSVHCFWLLAMHKDLFHIYLQALGQLKLQLVTTLVLIIVDVFVAVWVKLSVVVFTVVRTLVSVEVSVDVVTAVLVATAVLVLVAVIIAVVT